MRPSRSGRLKSRAVSRAMGCWRGRSYCLPPGLAFTPKFLLLRGGSAAGVGPSQNQPGPAVPRARPRRMVLKALFMVPAVSDLSFVNGWQPGSVLSLGLRPVVRGPVVRTAVSVPGPLEVARTSAPVGGEPLSKARDNRELYRILPKQQRPSTRSTGPLPSDSHR